MTYNVFGGTLSLYTTTTTTTTTTTKADTTCYMYVNYVSNNVIIYTFLFHRNVSTSVTPAVTVL